jgi:HCOMODA/2-hydroxy-3-carboxy-muconic semialdehyde decarboxylase
MGAYFAPRLPLWDDPQLVRSDAQAAALADEFGQARAILMRGNGTVTAAATLQEAVVLTYYLEDACRIELACLASGLAAEGAVMSAEESALRATWNGRILDRMWDYLTGPPA